MICRAVEARRRLPGSVRRHVQGRNRWSLWASLLCLWVYAGSLGWVAPLSTAALATLDDDHSVRMTVGTSGVQVVLAHDLRDPVRVPWHVHCPVARALVVLAPDSPEGVDHVLTFAKGLDVARRAEPLDPDSSQLVLLAVSLVRQLSPETARVRPVPRPALLLDSTATQVVRVTVILC